MKLYFNAIELRAISLPINELPLTQWDATTCNNCKKLVVVENGVCPKCQHTDQASELLFNWVWPLPEFSPDLIPSAKNWPGDVSLVQFHLDDIRESIIECVEYEYGLTGTCCGTDRTWALAKSYVIMGYYPPVEIARAVREITGIQWTKVDRAVFTACLRSLSASTFRNKRATKELRTLRETVKKHGK